MNIKYESKFYKDLGGIRDSKLLAKMKEVIIDCKAADNITELKHLKKLQGYDCFYRIRIGDYRVGIEVLNDELIFTRLLHRKDIYKYFP